MRISLHLNRSWDHNFWKKKKLECQPNKASNLQAKGQPQPKSSLSQVRQNLNQTQISIVTQIKKRIVRQSNPLLLNLWLVRQRKLLRLIILASTNSNMKFYMLNTLVGLPNKSQASLNFNGRSKKEPWDPEELQPKLGLLNQEEFWLDTNTSKNIADMIPNYASTNGFTSPTKPKLYGSALHQEKSHNWRMKV